MKTNAINWKKILVNFISKKVYLSGIYKELSLSNQKTSKLNT